MIKAHFYISGCGLCGFSVSGHAGYADKGHDIVCASVSSAVQMTANTVTEILNVACDVTDKSGVISLKLSDNSDKKFQSAQDIIKGLRLHLTILSEQFPGTVLIEDSEV